MPTNKWTATFDAVNTTKADLYVYTYIYTL